MPLGPPGSRVSPSPSQVTPAVPRGTSPATCPTNGGQDVHHRDTRRSIGGVPSGGSPAMSAAPREISSDVLASLLSDHEEDTAAGIAERRRPPGRRGPGDTARAEGPAPRPPVGVPLAVDDHGVGRGDCPRSPMTARVGRGPATRLHVRPASPRSSPFRAAPHRQKSREAVGHGHRT